MGRFLEYWKMAYFNNRMNKVRSFLTMLGIIIGISSVVGILSIGGGFNNYISGSLNGLVGSNFSIYANGNTKIPRSALENMVEKYPHIVDYSEDYGAQATATDLKGEEAKFMITSGRPIIQQSNRSELQYGRFFDQSEYDNAANVCVIDTYAARKLFGVEDATGKMIRLDVYGRELNLKVVGVRKSSRIVDDEEKKDEVEADGADNAMIVVYEESSLSMEMPYTVLTRTMGLDPDAFYNATVFVDEPGNVAEMAAKGQRYLEAVTDKRGEDQFMVLELTSLVSGLSSILTGITAFIMLVAAISLFVGGVGVMNIMLVSVTERTREIGIRKSLGARTSSIMWQFLIESGLIALTGGIIGILLGYAFSGLICVVVHLVRDSITLVPDFNPFFILGAALFSMGIGIIFGLYPARKAAKMTPIDALRHK